MRSGRRSGPREDVSSVSAAARPVLLATFDVPFAEDAIAFAVDAAVENGQPLVIVNVAEILSFSAAAKNSSHLRHAMRSRRSTSGASSPKRAGL